MKNSLKVLAQSFALSVLAVFSQAAAGSETPSANVAEQLRQLQAQVEEQGKRIDRLYRALGSELEQYEQRAERIEQQQREDKALGLERIREVADEGLTSLGCVNPAAAEFAVITSDGRLRIFDGQGKAGKEFQQPGQEFTAVAYSPNGKEVLTGTETGALLVWDVAKAVA
jgi:TolA-binding protein